MKFIIGIITAILFCGVLIWSIEQGYSILQVIFGFIVFLLPVVFLSAIKGNVSIFSMLSFAIVFVYLSYKWEFYHVYAGILLAIILGFPIHYYKVRNVK
jgi:hypothetical protein